MTRRGTTGIWEAFVPGAGTGAALQVPPDPQGPRRSRGQGRPLRPPRRGPPRHRLRDPRPRHLARLPLDGRGLDGRAPPAPGARPAPLHLRGAPRLLAPRPGGGQPAPDLPRAGPGPAPLRARPGVHPRGADAGDRVPVRRLLGLPGLGLLRPHGPLRVAGGPAGVCGRLPRPRPGGAPGLGAGALRQGGARAGPLRRDAPLRAPRPAHRRAPRLGFLHLRLRPGRGAQLPPGERPLLAGGVPRGRLPGGRRGLHDLARPRPAGEPLGR